LFEWDRLKAANNLKKHGVSFDEAKSAFADPLSLTIDDPYHSDSEDRFVTIGRSDSERLLIVVHTDRDELIRIISAREATKGEMKQYEEG
jgi:uncharacterized protein